MKGILYDLPQDLQRPGQFCRLKGSKIDVTSRQDHSSIPYQRVETSTCSTHFHDWPDDKAATILANCRKAIKDDGTLLIREA